MAVVQKFYVYEHWRPDKDVCFYVGKGRGNRAYSLKGRGSHHERIVAKLKRLGMCMEIRLVADGLSEAEAFAIEIERIRFWRDMRGEIINKTDGGEGVSGLVHSAESRLKMSLAMKGRPGRITMLGKKHKPETIALMSAAKKGKKPNNFGKVRSDAAKKRQVESAKNTYADPARKAEIIKKKGKYYLTDEFRKTMSIAGKAGWITRRKNNLIKGGVA